MSDTIVSESAERLCDCCHLPATGGGTTPGKQRLCSMCWSNEPALPSVLRGMAARELDVQAQVQELDAQALGWRASGDKAT